MAYSLDPEVFEDEEIFDFPYEDPGPTDEEIEEMAEYFSYDDPIRMCEVLIASR